MRITPLFGPFLSMIVAVFVVAGCAAPQPVSALPEIRFTDKQPLNLDVGRIDIISEYTSPFRSPNVEHSMPVSPEKVARTWANDRLRAVGPEARIAQFIIKNASVIETPLKVDPGFTGLFKKEQSERYVGKLEVALEIRDQNGRVVGESSAKAEISRTVGEDVTIADREAVWHDMSKKLANDIDALLEENMRRYMAKFIML